jgi:DNA replication and repair protein RecF
VIDAEFIKNERNASGMQFEERSKVLKRNGKAYDKFSDHIGFIPLVIISPADRDLIVEGKPDGNSWIASSHS